VPGKQGERQRPKRRLTLPNSTLLMTFSATSPGSGFHGELMLCWAGVGLVGRSVEVGAWRVWVKKVDGGGKKRKERERE
jgi:hypothetical protein